MRPDLASLLMVPAERLEDRRLVALLAAVAEAIQNTNDPGTLRVLGQVLKAMGDTARSEAYSVTGEHW